MSADNFVVGAVIRATVDRSFVKTVEQTGRMGKQLGGTWRKTMKKVTATGDVVKLSKELEGLRGKLKGAGAGAAELRLEIVKKEKALAEAQGRMRKYGLSVGEVSKEQKRLQRELAATETRMKRIDRHAAAAEKFRHARYTIGGIVASMYGVGRLVGGAREDQRAGQRLATVMVDAAGGDVGAAHAMAAGEVAWARGASRGPAPLMASAEDLLAAQYSLRSADSTLTADEARVGAAVAHRLATVVGGDAESTASMLATVNNTLGAAIADSMSEGLPKIAEALNATVARFQVRDLPQLAEGLKMVAPTAQARGVSPHETLALVGAVSSGGLAGSEGGTAVNEMLARLPVVAEKLGVGVATLADGQSLDAAGTLARVEAALPRQLQARGDALRQLFGETGSRAAQIVLPGLGEVAAGAGAIESAMAGDALRQHYDTIMQSEDGRIQLARQQLAAVGTTVAAIVLPALAEGAGWAGALANSFGALVDRWAVAGTVLAVFIAALGAGVGIWAAWRAGAVAVTGLMIGANAVTSVGTFVQTIYNQGLWKTVKATKAWTAVTKAAAVAQRVLNFAVKRNPIVGAILLAITLIGVFHKQIGKVLMKFEPLRKFFEGVKNWWGSKVGGQVGDAIAPPGPASPRAGPASAAAASAGLAVGAVGGAPAMPAYDADFLGAQEPVAATAPAYPDASSRPPIVVNYYGGPITIEAPSGANAEELVDLLAERLRREIEGDLSEAIRRGMADSRYRLIDG